jgi:intein-encoded DNA endonuclease-like protein
MANKPKLSEQEIIELKQNIDKLPPKEKIYQGLEVIKEIEPNIKSLKKDKNYSYSQIRDYLQAESKVKLTTNEVLVLCEEGYAEFEKKFSKNKNSKNFK